MLQWFEFDPFFHILSIFLIIESVLSTIFELIYSVNEKVAPKHIYGLNNSNLQLMGWNRSPIICKRFLFLLEESLKE